MSVKLSVVLMPLVVILTAGTLIAQTQKSGMVHLKAATGQPIVSEKAVVDEQTIEPTKTITKKEGGTEVCTTTPIIENASITLSGAPVLGSAASLYPGAVLQGKFLAKGQYLPVDIKRARGKITLGGVRFDLSAGAPRMLKRVDEMSKARVVQEIATLLGQPSPSSESHVSFKVITAQSKEDLVFQLGGDARFVGDDLNKIFSSSKPSNQSMVVLRYIRVYYDVSANLPANMEDVFEAGEDFEDTNNQIGADNVPLFVSNVAYGTQTYVVVHSDKDSATLAAALQSAFSDEESEEASQVLSGAEVAVLALGLKNAQSESQTLKGDIFKQLRRILKTQREEIVSGNNLGVPVYYSAKMLTSNNTPTLAYTRKYTKTDCTFVPRGWHSFSLELSKVNGNVEVSTWPQSDPDKKRKVYSADRGQNLKLDSFVPAKDEDWIVDVQLLRKKMMKGDKEAFSEAGVVDVLLKHISPEAVVDYLSSSKENEPIRILCETGIAKACAGIQIKVNRSTGKFEVVQPGNSNTAVSD